MQFIVPVKCVQSVYVFARTSILSHCVYQLHQQLQEHEKRRNKKWTKTQTHTHERSKETWSIFFHISFVITYSLCTERTQWNDSAEWRMYNSHVSVAVAALRTLCYIVNVMLAFFWRKKKKNATHLCDATVCSASLSLSVCVVITLRNGDTVFFSFEHIVIECVRKRMCLNTETKHVIYISLQTHICLVFSTLSLSNVPHVDSKCKGNFHAAQTFNFGVISTKFDSFAQKCNKISLTILSVCLFRFFISLTRAFFLNRLIYEA